MPTEILIFSRRNGRTLKTYGVKRAEHIMKFSFIFIVVFLSCGFCASGDLEIYPRLRFNFNDDRKYRLKKYEQPDSFANYRFPFSLEGFSNGELPYNSDDENLAERLNQLKQFEEVIDFERIQLMKQNHRAKPKHKYRHQIEEEPKSFKPSNLLEEARVYAHDDDFGFIVNDNEEGNVRDLIDTPTEKEIVENSHMHDVDQDMHETDDDEDDATTRRFQDIQVMDDPSNFAYVPSDPRFNRKADENGIEKPYQETLGPVNKITPVARTPDNTVSVTYRSEHKYQQAKMQQPDDTSSGLSTRFSDSDIVAVKPSLADMDSAGVYVIAIVAGISAAATVGLIAVGIGWYNLQKHVKNASDVEYPAYGITGPNKDLSPSGDRRLAQSAQMYHYQHQKQQIIAMESAQPSFAISRAQPGERHGSVSEADSDEENEEGDYTVYECPGLAPTGEMEVKNPLFQDDPTPAQTPAVKSTSDEKK